MNNSTTSRPASWLAIAPETWRRDLLGVVLRISAVLGSIVYIPSAYLGVKFSMWGVVVIDTVTLALLFGLLLFERVPTGIRAACACTAFYAVGAGLLINVGSVSQIYLFGFSLLTTLLLGFRWGSASVVLNALTMFVVGYVGVTKPDMVVPKWDPNLTSWSVITLNFVFVNASLVLALGAVIRALESALAGAVGARDSLEHDRRTLVTLNQTLEHEVLERVRTEQSLRESKALLRIAGRTARLGGWRVELGSQRISWSDEVCELHQMPHGSSPTYAEASAFFSPEFRGAISDAVERCSRDGTPFDVEAEITTAKGAQLWVRVIGNADRDAAGAITNVHGSIQDVTPQRTSDARNRTLEEQFRQAQKMETIGSLAGGIAHDFNNLMSIVVSYSDMLADDLRKDDPMRADLLEIRAAGQRATDLTRQLLAFSRQQVLEPKVVDLSDIIGGMENMLRRLIGEDVELVVARHAGLGKVLVDPQQIEQVIMNLAVNARDAMPGGGKLTLELAEVWLDEAYAAQHSGVTAGAHVMLAVTDSGTGMDQATQARMFEPFFTTKDQGKGTGLGLATVFGIVRQSGGTIWAYSELGMGTTFKVYFPAALTTEAVVAPALAAVRRPRRGSETVLLVEDEESVRVLTRSILRKHGYRVVEAANGGEALLYCEQAQTHIHLLLTDVVMPRMSGRQLAERLLPMRPGMKVLYMSGYTDDAVVRHGLLDASLAFIQKPIMPEPLVRKVREVLDS